MLQGRRRPIQLRQVVAPLPSRGSAGYKMSRCKWKGGRSYFGMSIGKSIDWRVDWLAYASIVHCGGANWRDGNRSLADREDRARRNNEISH